MALSYVELLDKDGNTYRVLTDTIDEESNSHAQVFKPAYGADTDVTTVDTTTPLPVGLYNTTGSQYVLSTPVAPSATPSIDASLYAANDNLDGDIITFANAVGYSGGVSHLLGVEIQDKGDTGPDLSIFFLKASITPESQNAPFTMTDANAENIVAVVHTANGVWEDYVQGQKCFIACVPPKPVRSTGTSIYAVVRVNASYTPGTTSDLIITPTFLR